ncbi:MAG: hypothetical protein JRI23_27885 [Deltaproteobacteria bacterium]|jgi:hypothetical protein|nr:hypothetical protein [Deltaproteobacteria bacterium]
MRHAIIALCFVLAACSSTEAESPDAGAGLDAGSAGAPPSDAGSDAESDAGSDAESDAATFVPYVFDQVLIDEAVARDVPSTAGGYSSGGDGYGQNGPTMLFLAIAGRNDESLEATDGTNVRDRAVEHVKAALTPGLHPQLVGGHAAWFDQHVPMAFAIARRTPGMWDQLSTDERRRADLLMEHCLYVANIFCNTNSNDWSLRAMVNVDMHGSNAGSLPNQSASYHAYAIGAYVYFGGASGMNPLLAAYDLSSFRARLQAEGFDDIDDLYADTAIQQLFEGVEQGAGWNPDPLGVRKPLDQINTSSLEGSPAGEEHRYHGYDPVPATPPHIFMRWGNDFTVGAMPLSNVGPDADGDCGGIDFGLAQGTMPHESDGTGMPYELNARGSAGGPHTRSSWHYADRGMHQYMYMLATVAILGYWDGSDAAHQAALDLARRAVEIHRYVGENKWISSAGTPSEICTSNHGDAYGTWSCTHWAQHLMDLMLLSGAPLPYPPVVP